MLAICGVEILFIAKIFWVTIQTGIKKTRRNLNLTNIFYFYYFFIVVTFLMDWRELIALYIGPCVFCLFDVNYRHTYTIAGPSNPIIYQYYTEQLLGYGPIKTLWNTYLNDDNRVSERYGVYG